MAIVLGSLHSDNLGSEGDYDDTGYYEGHIVELFGSDIDPVLAHNTSMESSEARDGRSLTRRMASLATISRLGYSTTWIMTCTTS